MLPRKTSQRALKRPVPQTDLKSRVGRDLIAQIETRRKNGSVETLDRVARALGVPIEALIESTDP
jgi:transcriptional regulator with XRE-family HTH domain